MISDNDIDWSLTTWEGSRRAQLRAALKLTPQQRFEALEEMAETSRHLAEAGKRGRKAAPVAEPGGAYSSKTGKNRT